MAYVDPDFKTKKALREALAAGRAVYVFQPGGMFPLAKRKEHSVEGPHGVHKWYARVEVDENNRVVKVLS